MFSGQIKEMSSGKRKTENIIGNLSYSLKQYGKWETYPCKIC